MNYLLPAEYEQFGLETATSEALVRAASKLIDAHCRRTTLAMASYTERSRITAGRNTMRLSYLPLAAANAITTAKGRFGIPRRGDEARAELAHDVSVAFGLPGTWTTLDVTAFDYDAATGEVALPHHTLGLPYNEVEITYNAGLATISDEVKFACAQMVKNAQATPALTVKSGQVDKLKLEYFSDSLIDASVKKLLAPYVALRLG